MSAPHRRFVLHASGESDLPLIVESVGDNPDQEPISRPRGYPLYHWLQTTEGEGLLTLGERAIALPTHGGVLLMPGEPHAYAASVTPWRTRYLTFGGPAAPEILQTLGLGSSIHVNWEADSPLGSALDEMLNRLEREPESDLFGLQASSDAYRFLMLLRTYGVRARKGGALHRQVETLRPLIEWMERVYPDPAVGLEEMADVIGMPISSLGLLFRRTFGMSPYAYFLQLRIRKAQVLLTDNAETTVGEVAAAVGFRDVSHFVATFRKHVGMPPLKFRRLWASG